MEAAAPERPHPSLPNLLVRNRNFVMLWCAYGVAAIGDHLSEMALLTERGGLARDDVTRVQALMQFAFFLPFVLLGPIAGWWSDRFSRRSTMIVADLTRALIVFNLAWVVGRLKLWLEPGEVHSGLGDFAIAIPLALIGSLAAFFSPARQAMLPTLIRDDQLVRANSLISALGTIGAITGGVLGGVLVEHLGPGHLYWNYHINAATFACSAVFVSLIAMSRTRAAKHPQLAGIFAPVRDGFRYVLSHRRTLGLILLGAVFWAVAGVVISVVPAIVKEVFHGSIQDVAIYRGLLIVGLAIGAGVMSIIGPAMPLQLAIKLALLGGGLWVLALDLSFVFRIGRVFTAICLIGMGGAGAALLVTILATLQRIVPDSRRGRVFGVTDMCTMAAMVTASGALGLPRIEQLDRHIPLLLLAAAGALLGSLVAATLAYRRGDELDWLTRLIWHALRFVARFWWRTERHGICTVPLHGPVIVAANHAAGIDPLVIIATCPHRLPGFLVAQEYYRAPLAHWFMKRANCVPIDRRNPGKSFYTACLRTLNEGGCLGIFPTGTFEAPGQPPPPVKSGIGNIALRSGATVIPCRITGTTFRDNPFVSIFLRHRVRVKYGRPVDLSDLRAEPKAPGAADRAAARIMEAICALPIVTDQPGSLPGVAG